MNKSLLLSAVLCIPCSAAPPVADDRFVIVVRAESREERDRIVKCGVSIESVEDGRAVAIVRPAAVACIEKAGLRVESSRPLDSLDARDFPEWDAAYHNVKETDEELQELAADHKDRVSLSAYGKSLQGRALTVMRLDSTPEDECKPGVLFMANHHAREHLSTEVTLGIARQLLAERSKPGMAELLDSRDVYFMPIVNPDGKEFDYSTGRYEWHRKNMRDNGDGSVGVDLNRNYPVGWGGQGSSGEPDSDIYRGKKPLSEPETKAVSDFLRSHPNISIVISFHSYGRKVMYPWSHTTQPMPEPEALSAFKAMAEKMGQLTEYTPMQSSELYVSGGDTCDWAWEELGMFCFTIELPPRSFFDGGFYPGPEHIAPTTEANTKVAKYLLEIADDPYQAGGKAGVNRRSAALSAKCGKDRPGAALQDARAAVERLRTPSFDGEALR
jgi:carboxypeptidase T